MIPTGTTVNRRHDEIAKCTFNATVGRCIRTHRVAANMSQRELAEAVGVSASVIQNFEAGAAPCPLFTAANIAEALDCTIDDLAPVTIDEPEED